MNHLVSVYLVRMFYFQNQTNDWYHRSRLNFWMSGASNTLLPAMTAYLELLPILSGVSCVQLSSKSQIKYVLVFVT